MHKGVLWLVGLFVLVVVLASRFPAPDSSPPQAGAATAEPTAAPQLGQPFAAGNWRYTVHAAERRKELVASQFTKDTAKGEFVVVPVTVENIGKQNFGLNTWDFTLYDANRVKYDMASIYPTTWAKASGFAGIIGADTRQMPPGVPTKYAAVFDVTPGSQGLRLALNQPKVEVALP